MKHTENCNRGGQFSTSRIAGLDLLRSLAIFSVIGVHFFLNTPFAKTPFVGSSMFLQGIVQHLMGVGVPLFLLLTGYLNINKKLSRSYSRGLVRVLSAYLLYSRFTIVFRIGYLGEEYSVQFWIHSILKFSAIGYAWYIEMWIGLFLLTPFLNVLYKNLSSRREKQVLIVTLVMLSLMAKFANRYDLHVGPGFWESIYPLAYYFAGAYIREYKPRISIVKGLTVIIGLSLLNPLFNTFFMGNSKMVYPFGNSDTPLYFVLSLCVFLLLYQRDVKHAATRAVLMSVSLLSLDMYLVSFAFDRLYYPLMMQHFFVSQSQFGIYWFVIPPMVFVSSYVVSYIIHPLLPTGKPRVKIPRNKS